MSLMDINEVISAYGEGEIDPKMAIQLGLDHLKQLKQRQIAVDAKRLIHETRVESLERELELLQTQMKNRLKRERPKRKDNQEPEVPDETGDK